MAETLKELEAMSPATNSFTSPSGFNNADWEFDMGKYEESNGNFRSALSHFHAASVLYCSRIQHPQAFQYATSHNSSTLSSILAYSCIRLAHLSHDALGDSMAGVRLYQDALEIDASPSAVSYDGVGTCIEASGLGPERALPYYEKAVGLGGGKGGNSAFHCAVALERTGRQHEAREIFDRMRSGGMGERGLVDSWGYVRWHMRNDNDTNLHKGTREMLEIAIGEAKDGIEGGGMICEFGVSRGRSMRMLEEILPKDRVIYGFDTFEGLPEAWGDEKAGTYTAGGKVPQFGANVRIRQGLFDESIKAWLKEKEVSRLPLAFANIDCDLYSSTTSVLSQLQPRIVPGTILIFDEYICHPTWRNDEFRAWREAVKRFGWNYEYIAFSLTSKQAIVRIL